MAFFRELKRRNVVETGILYLVSSWLNLHVADLLFDLAGLPASWLRLVLVLLALGFPLVIIIGGQDREESNGQRSADRSQDPHLIETAPRRRIMGAPRAPHFTGDCPPTSRTSVRALTGRLQRQAASAKGGVAARAGEFGRWRSDEFPLNLTDSVARTLPG